MRRTARLAVVSVVALAAAFAAPAAASASTIYPPTNACTTTPSTFTAGSTVQFACDADTFGSDEPVTITVTGENGASVAFGRVAFAVSTANTLRQSTAAGALEPVSITFPDDAVGVYNVEAISPSSAGGVASASVVTDAGLPATGAESRTLLGLWIGGGALVAAGATIVVTAAVRRSQDARI